MVVEDVVLRVMVVMLVMVIIVAKEKVIVCMQIFQDKDSIVFVSG